MKPSLFDFEVKRTKLQALGFYCIFLIIGLTLCALVPMVVCSIVLPPDASFDDGYKLGQRVGLYVMLFYTFILGSWIIFTKKIYAHFGAILLLFFGTFISYLFGGILGLMFIASLTTFESKNKEELDQI